MINKYVDNLRKNQSGVWRLYKRVKTFVTQELFFLELSKCDPHRKKILLINHFFDGEIESLKKEIENYNDFDILTIEPEPFFSDAFEIFPQTIKDGKIPYDDISTYEIRKKQRIKIAALLKRLQSIFEIKYVITPSDSFFWIREFICECQRVGIKTIVADKEGTISPHSFIHESIRIRKLFPPIADEYIVWSDRQRDFWINAGVHPENIKVVGSLRSDIFVNQKIVSKNNVLFFDFDEDAYINLVDQKILNRCVFKSWKNLREEILDSLYLFAKSNPNIKIFIKCHPQQSKTTFPNRIVELRNVEVIKGRSKKMDELFSKVDIVIGFQTTALLESSLAGKTTLYCYWGDLYSEVRDLVLPWHDNRYGMACVTNKEHLDRILDNFKLGKAIPVASDKSGIYEYFFKPDGNVAKRFMKAILNND